MPATLPLKIVPDRFHEAGIISTLTELRIRRSYSWQNQTLKSPRDLLSKSYADRGLQLDVDTKLFPKHLDPHPDYQLARVRSINVEPHGADATMVVYDYVQYRFLTPQHPEEFSAIEGGLYQTGDFFNCLIGPPVFETQTTLQEITTDSKRPDGYGTFAVLQLGNSAPAKTDPDPFNNVLVPIQVANVSGWNPDAKNTGGQLPGNSPAIPAKNLPILLDIGSALSLYTGPGTGDPRVAPQAARVEGLRPIESIVVKHYIYLVDVTKNITDVDKQIALWRQQYVGCVNDQDMTIHGVTVKARTCILYDLNTTTMDTGDTVLVQWRLAIKQLYGNGAEGGWDPWVAAIDPVTGEIPNAARKVMNPDGTVNFAKTNGYMRVQDPPQNDFTILPWFIEQGT